MKVSIKSKACTQCHKEKDRDAFARCSKRKDGLASNCKECMAERWQVWAAANRQKLKAHREYLSKSGIGRARKIKSRYGITAEQYKAMFDSQGGKCPGCDCDLDLSSRQTHVDHDHATGQVRGLLCWPCNRRLGTLETKTDINAKLLAWAKSKTQSP